jgi:hypothetical protein
MSRHEDLMTGKPTDQYTVEETARRMKNAIRLALNTPPKPHKEMVGKTAKASRKKKKQGTARSPSKGA